MHQEPSTARETLAGTPRPVSTLTFTGVVSELVALEGRQVVLEVAPVCASTGVPLVQVRGAVRAVRPCDQEDAVRFRVDRVVVRLAAADLRAACRGPRAVLARFGDTEVEVAPLQ